jgi:hypothetical protein
MSYFLTCFILLIALLPKGMGQSLNFYRESLNFEIDSSHFYVSGMYFIRNQSDKVLETPIIYPYIYDTKIIDTISVYNCNTMQYLDVHKETKSHRFILKIPANDSVVLHIKYSHRHNRKDVTYILMTTHAWGRAFEQADYTLRVKSGIKIKQLFLPPDSTWSENNYTYYHWERNNFMPESDFNVTFE